MIEKSHLEQQMIDMISGSDWHMKVMHAVKQLNLPDCWIGAGFIRSYVWDQLHDYPVRTPLGDIDVVYFNPDCIDKKVEKEYDHQLLKIMPDEPWSVKNQARMYQIYGDTPYKNTKDGLCHWTETVTATAVCLNDKGEVEVLAPFGLEDLFSMQVKPTPHALTRAEDYNNRLKNKSWDKKWSKVNIKLLTI